MGKALKNSNFNSISTGSSENVLDQHSQYYHYQQQQHKYLDNEHHLNIMAIIKHDCPYISLSEPNIYRKDGPFSSTLTLHQYEEISALETKFHERNAQYRLYNERNVKGKVKLKKFKKETKKGNNLFHAICVILFNLSCIALYLIFGAVMFPVLERAEEMKHRNRITEMCKDFLDLYHIKENDLEDFLTAVVSANDRGISPLRNASNDMNWAFGQAIFFSSSILTTIGYGRVAPLSQTGKLFCMFYAIIGIPYTLMLIGNIVTRLNTLTDRFLGYLNTKLGHLYQPFNIRVMHLTIIVIIVGILFFIIPSVLFTYLEPTWSFLDAFYYCFISLTTIGLGDYVPGAGVSNENQSLYKIFITTYLILGLIAMMLVITIYTDIPQAYLGQTFSSTSTAAMMMKHGGNKVGDNEKSRLSDKNTTIYSGTESFNIYMPQHNDGNHGDNCRSIVKVRPHGDDSPSPDERPSSSAAANK